MNPTRIWILVILMFCENVSKGMGKDIRVVEGQSVEIRCQPGSWPIIVWFRVLDSSGMEFLASYHNSVIKKSSPNFNEIFLLTTQNTLKLKAFNGRRDSGIYSCGSVIKNTEMTFGEVTRLFEGQKSTESTTKAALELTNKPEPSVNSTPCMCTDEGHKGSSVDLLFCAPLVLIPLVSGCAFLLVLLFITILYCNRIRTRRCPHHYKRKLGTAVPVKQMNRPV